MWRHLLHYPIIKKSVFAQEQLGMMPLDNEDLEYQDIDTKLSIDTIFSHQMLMCIASL